MVRQAEKYDLASTESKAGEPRGVARGTCQFGSPAALVGEEPQDNEKTEDSEYPGLGRHRQSAEGRDAEEANGR